MPDSRLAPHPALPSRSLLLALVVGCALAVTRPLEAAEAPAGSAARSFAQAVDAAAEAVLAESGAPGASVAVIRDGKLVLTKAYGAARLEPKLAATPDMRFAIGSISKQFLAAAVLLLAEDGKLALDDHVSRWLPGLTRANEVTLRQLLSHTAGYRDYWPQDYVPPTMLQPISREQLLHDWATLPLDFEPGSEYQYSNTGFVVVGAIVEKVTQKPLMQFLRERIFVPLGLETATDIDAGRLGAADSTGYQRFALGPRRLAPKEGAGWLFAAAELAMTARDLARWDAALIDGRILSPTSWRAMTESTRLTNGASAQYGLGVDVRITAGHRVISHGGEVSGYTAANSIFPDDHAAIVVLTNVDASDAPDKLTDRIRALLFVDDSPTGSRQLERARRLFAGLQRGTPDRSLLTPNCSGYFSTQAVADFKASLGPLGVPKKFEQELERLRGGMRLRRYVLDFAGDHSIIIVARELPDGRFEQFQVQPH